MMKNVITELFLPNIVLSYTSSLPPSCVAPILSLHSMTVGNGTASPRLPGKPHDVSWQSAINTLTICASHVTGALDS